MQAAGSHPTIPSSSQPAFHWHCPDKTGGMNNNPRKAGNSEIWEIKDVIRVNAFDLCKHVGAVQAPGGVSGHLVMAGDPRCWSNKQTMPEGRTI
jgi:hypothetical protein